MLSYLEVVVCHICAWRCDIHLHFADARQIRFPFRKNIRRLAQISNRLGLPAVLFSTLGWLGPFLFLWLPSLRLCVCVCFASVHMCVISPEDVCLAGFFARSRYTFCNGLLAVPLLRLVHSMHGNVRKSGRKKAESKEIVIDQAHDMMALMPLLSLSSM